MFLLEALVTGPSFVSISLLFAELWQSELLTRNPKIGYTPVWVFLNTWRLEQVRGTKFGKNVSYKSEWMLVNARNYSFYHFWVIKGKSTEGVKNTPNLIRIRKTSFLRNSKNKSELRVLKYNLPDRGTWDWELVLRFVIFKCMVSASFTFHTTFKVVLEDLIEMLMKFVK